MKSSEISEKLNEQLKGVPRAEIRAANLEVYPRMVEALYNRSSSCDRCRELYDESSKFTDDIASVIKGTPEQRKEFEEFVRVAYMHLHEVHKTLPKGKILSVSVLVGMLLGLSFAVIIGYFMDQDLLRYGALGWILGVIAGWITGKIRENNLRKKNRQF